MSLGRTLIHRCGVDKHPAFIPGPHYIIPQARPAEVVKTLSARRKEAPSSEISRCCSPCGIDQFISAQDKPLRQRMWLTYPDRTTSNWFEVPADLRHAYNSCTSSNDVNVLKQEHSSINAVLEWRGSYYGWVGLPFHSHLAGWRWWLYVIDEPDPRQQSNSWMRYQQ